MVRGYISLPPSNVIQLRLNDVRGPLIRGIEQFDPRRELEVFIDGISTPIILSVWDNAKNTYNLMMQDVVDISSIVQIIHHVPNPPYSTDPAVIPQGAIPDQLPGFVVLCAVDYNPLYAFNDAAKAATGGGAASPSFSWTVDIPATSPPWSTLLNPSLTFGGNILSSPVIAASNVPVGRTIHVQRVTPQPVGLDAPVFTSTSTYTPTSGDGVRVSNLSDFGGWQNADTTLNLNTWPQHWIEADGVGVVGPVGHGAASTPWPAGTLGAIDKGRLLGAWTNNNGDVVQAVWGGDSFTTTCPAGASQLVLGFNWDDWTRAFCSTCTWVTLPITCGDCQNLAYPFGDRYNECDAPPEGVEIRVNASNFYSCQAMFLDSWGNQMGGLIGGGTFAAGTSVRAYVPFGAIKIRCYAHAGNFADITQSFQKNIGSGWQASSWLSGATNVGVNLLASIGNPNGIRAAFAGHAGVSGTLPYLVRVWFTSSISSGDYTADKNAGIVLSFTLDGFSTVDHVDALTSTAVDVDGHQTDWLPVPTTATYWNWEVLTNPHTFTSSDYDYTTNLNFLPFNTNATGTWRYQLSYSLA